MPALVLFSRKWRLGSDELVYPAALDLLIRKVWMLALVIIYSSTGQEGSLEWCEAYLIVASCIVLTICLGDIGLALTSMRGGIMNTKARRFVPLTLYFRFALQILELGWNICGTVWSFRENSSQISETVQGTANGLLITNWILFIFTLLYCYLHYDSGYSTRGMESKRSHRSIICPSGNKNPSKYSQGSAWERRLRLLWCCVQKSPDVHNGIREVGDVTASTFANRDLVYFDVMIGVMLLKIWNERLWKSKEQPPSETVLSRSSNTGSAKNPEFPSGVNDWNSLLNLEYFFKPAWSLYGTIVTRRIFPNRFYSKVYRRMLCCSFCPWKKYGINSEGDDCCFSQTASLRFFFEDSDIVYASFRNGDFHSPFVICMDHERKTVVMYIRATFSLTDIMVDGICEPVAMEISGLPAHFKAHHGILLVARRLKKILDEKKILQKVLLVHSDYDLRLIGPSLGGGVATILGMMLKEDFPNLKCIAYSPPGALLSFEAAEYCNDFVTSVVYGIDVISRLSLKAVDRTMDDLAEILHKCETPKYRLQFRAAMSWLRLKKMSVEFCESQKEAEDGGEDSQAARPQEPECSETNSRLDMFLPGRIIHIKGTEHSSKQNVEKEKALPANIKLSTSWEANWADRTHFNRIIIRKGMIKHHFDPGLMARSLEALSEADKAFALARAPDPVTITIQPGVVNPGFIHE